MTSSLPAQNIDKIDSLKRIARTTEGVDRFNVLNDLGFEYRLSYPDSTIFYCEQAYALGRQLNLRIGLSKPLSFIGLASAYKGDYQASFDYHNRAVTLAQEEGDSAQMAYGYNNFGRLFFDQGDMVRAYNNLVKAGEIFQALDDKIGLSYVQRSLSNLYKSQGDFPKALQASIRAYSLRKEAGAARGILSALMELGLVYEEVNDTLNAVRSLRQADSIARKINDQISQAEIGLALADILVDQNRIEEGFEEANYAYDIIVNTGNIRLRPAAYLMLGRLYLKQDNPRMAVEPLTTVLSEGHGGSLIQQRDAHQYLSEVYKALGDQRKTIEHTNRYLMLKESLQNVDLARQIERLQFQLEIEKKEKENQLLMASKTANEASIQQQKLQNLMLVGIIAFISILALVHWMNSRKRKEVNEKLALQNSEIQKQREEIVRQNQKLSKRNVELSDLNHEKDTLMSIVAHDLKSPLNRIKGLSDIMEMEKSHPESFETYLQLIKNATQAGLDLIKDLLDVNMLEESNQPSWSSIKLRPFIHEKIAGFRQAANAKQIVLDDSAVADEEITSDEDYLGRILDNLISNAIKFSKNKSEVNIAAGRQENGFWIRVKDQGPGFSEKDKTLLFQKFRKLSARPTGGETSNGLGLAIVKTLVDRMGGIISLESEPGKGSEFIIKVPVKQPVELHKA